DELASVLSRPAARCRVDGVDRDLLLPEVAEIRASGALVVDACRRAVRLGEAEMSLARRPILFVLLAALADAWPAEVGREVLIERAFRIRRPDETHRARLRVEIGRLRKWVAGGATIQATARGFVMQARDARAILLLRPPADGAQGTLAALLADGAPWSTSSLALAVGASQRTVQRALVELEAEGRVRAVGRAGARRWLAPARIGHTTILLLPGSLAPG
ncbi:MAG TPA: helix-turn-helix domain-containing protein, partial [Burkholderiaceae bacterium]|nr:helix-turn-helix domain-containing protein [Burkholderiaceae bacterium]